MTDKQVIIDGVDVSGCEFLWKEKLQKKVCNNGNLDCDCNSNPNCYFNHLKQKEQALDEIEKFCKDVCDSCKKFTPKRQSDISCGLCQATQILNIINKTKGGK